ncbi:hypothetical protein V8C86DRAFT_2889529 [Haematococcus lacustris]|nr:hypothetical protein QJQ45_025470 [Haematococcus lacustris]
MLHQQPVFRANPAPTHSSRVARCIRIACLSANNSAEDLTKYVSMLSKEEQNEVLSKFTAAGFTGAKQVLVPGLSNQTLEAIGIQPQAVRSALLQAFCEAFTGPGKTIVLVDSTGTEEELSFYKQDFNRWIQTNSLTQLLPTGKKQVVATWERLEDGGRYLTDRTLSKRVSDAEGFQSTQSKSLEDEVVEKALADMMQHHPEAFRLCVDELKNKGGQSRQYDGIIVADNCVKVVEVKSKVDIGAASQLGTAIEFMWQAAEEGAPDFHFARRADGSVKDIKGALGGLRLVAGDQNKKDLERTINKEQYDLYLPNGKRFSNGSACHPMQDPPSHC